MSDHQHTRPPLDADAAAAALDAAGPAGWRVEVLERTTSTNAELGDRFRAGEEGGLVLAAEEQSAGRGRLGREWVTPPRASLTVSFLLVPGQVDPDRWSWLPLAAGLAAAAAVRRATGAEVGLKWPNDVLHDGRKLGGILVERVDHDGRTAAIVGIGLNCTQEQDELPVPGATSLALVTGDEVDRTALLAVLTEEVARQQDVWRSGADLRAAYLQLCTTPGQHVRVAVPGGELEGEAVDVDAAGRLVVRTEAGEEHLGAGDVVHVRPTA